MCSVPAPAKLWRRGEIRCRATLSTQMIWFRYSSITLIPRCAEDIEDLRRTVTLLKQSANSETLATAIPHAFTSSGVVYKSRSFVKISTGRQCTHLRLPQLG